MTSNSAPGYAAAEVLLDAVIAFDSDDLEVSVDAVNLALRRLADVEGAYTVDVDDDPGGDLAVAVDLSHLVGGTVVAISRLVTLLAEATDATPEAVVADLREWLSQAP